MKRKLCMRQCTWKDTPTTGTYGGRETNFPILGNYSKMIFLKDFKESPSTNSFQSLPGYNRKEMSMNSHINGYPLPRECLDYFTE